MDCSQILLAIAGLLLAIFFLFQKQRKTKDSVKTPPEPPGAWPIIGHLHKLGGNSIHRVWAEMADKYGPVFSLKMGMKRVVVVSNWEAVKECFTTNDKSLADRPHSSAGAHLGYNFAAIAVAPYGPYWREMRKLVLLEVLSHRRLEMLKHIRTSEIETSINELYSKVVVSNNNNNGSPKSVVISHWFEQVTLNMILSTIAGERFSDKSNEATQNISKVVKEFMYNCGRFVISDYMPLPFLKWLDLQGTIKEMKRVAKDVDDMCQTWIDEHVERRKRGETGLGNEKDFIDVLLSVIEDKSIFGHTRENTIKALVMNLILAGSDTTGVTLTWLVSVLLNDRDIMRKIQEEIDTKIGKERWVEDTDIKDLVYLRAVMKEAFRLYPAGPVLAPHLAMEDCTVSGYLVPKGSTLFVNAWKLHRDPNTWSEPEKFMPERFLTKQAEFDVFGHNFEYVPFGSGRRSCPGITFALQVGHLTLARLLQGFDMTTPSNLPVDMTEGQGIVLPKATPVEVLMTPRLAASLYQIKNS